MDTQVTKTSSSALQNISDQINETRAKAHADNTRSAYNSDWRHFQNWCLDRKLNALPTSPRIVEMYLNDIKSQFKVSTLMRRVSSINKAHTKGKLPLPKDEDLKEYLKGLRNERDGREKKKAKAAMAIDLKSILKGLYESTSHKALRDRTMLLVGFVGGMRRSEIAALKWEDLEFDEEVGYTMTVWNSKTDKENKGKLKILPYYSEPFLCPVRALHKLKSISTSEFVFQGMSKSGKITGDSISNMGVHRVIKKYLGDGYSPHSLRRGFVTQAKMNGEDLSNIMVQTGHKDISTVMGYIERVSVWKDNAALDIFR